MAAQAGSCDCVCSPCRTAGIRKSKSSKRVERCTAQRGSAALACMESQGLLPPRCAAAHLHQQVCEQRLVLVLVLRQGSQRGERLVQHRLQ